MKTRFTRLLAALVLAATALTASAPLTSAASGGACINTTGTNTWVGHTRDHATNIIGTKATISTTSGYFYPCSQNNGNDGSLAWVAFTPGSGNSHFNDSNAIIQVGIINCNNPILSGCTGTGPRYFWASGGCNLQSPGAADLGAATYGAHNYEVKLNTTLSTIEMYIDGVMKQSVSTGFAAINCWITGDREAQWYGERWDRGDSLGDGNNGRLQVYTERYQIVGGSYTSPNNSSCYNSAPSGTGYATCSYGSDYFNAWTTY